MEIKELLKEREKTHGDFIHHSIASQFLKSTMYDSKNWGSLGFSQKESLEMIAHKIARILNGDPNTKDHWDDIAGYATLVSNSIEGKNE